MGRRRGRLRKNDRRGLVITMPKKKGKKKGKKGKGNK